MLAGTFCYWNKFYFRKKNKDTQHENRIISITVLSINVYLKIKINNYQTNFAYYRKKCIFLILF